MVWAATVILSACTSSGGPGMEVSTVSSATYPAVPTNACRVSSRPPKGTYVVIANLSATAQVGESATHLLHRLQAQGAALGSTYVMVTSVTDKKYVNPENSEIADNPYLSQENAFFNTASPQSVAYNHEFDNPASGAVGYQSVNDIGSSSSTLMQEVVTAQALKITSGTNKPNKALPSNLWQMNH